MNAAPVDVNGHSELRKRIGEARLSVSLGDSLGSREDHAAFRTSDSPKLRFVFDTRKSCDLFGDTRIFRTADQVTR
jgi:hypothetical protein